MSEDQVKKEEELKDEALEVAEELKRWILEEGFVLGVPQRTLPGPAA